MMTVFLFYPKGYGVSLLGLPVPASPSYPSEHAATAQAAATILAYFLPAEAQSFQTMAEQAGWSRVLAGLQYPSDYYAGLTLGRRVADQVIAKAMRDGADAVWTGSVPTGACKWTGTNPGNVTAVNWIPLLLTSPNQFRPAPPPACDSAQVMAETAEVRDFPRTFVTNYKAFYWQSPEGLQTWPYRYADKWMFEDGLDQNPPRAARVYALIAAALFDAFIASQDGKFAYWYLRPHQNDPRIVPIFPVPNFPSYRQTTRRSRPPGRRCSHIYFPLTQTSFALSGRKLATPEFGRAFTSRWTTLPGYNSASPSRNFYLLGADGFPQCDRAYTDTGRWAILCGRWLDLESDQKARPNASVRLLGALNSKPWEVAQWAVTDVNGSYSSVGDVCQRNRGQLCTDCCRRRIVLKLRVLCSFKLQSLNPTIGRDATIPRVPLRLPVVAIRSKAPLISVQSSCRRM